MAVAFKAEQVAQALLVKDLPGVAGQVAHLTAAAAVAAQVQWVLTEQPLVAVLVAQAYHQ